MQIFSDVFFKAYELKNSNIKDVTDKNTYYMYELIIN